MLKNGIAGTYGAFGFSFLGTFLLFSIVAVPIFILIHSVWGFLFLHTLFSAYYL